MLAIERAAVAYCCATLLLMAVLWPQLMRPADMLAMRGMWALMTLALITLGTVVSARWQAMRLWTVLVRVAAQLMWLQQWYPDTYELNSSFCNLDYLFASWEQSLFGCQPSIEFSAALPQPFWSEAFNLGYASYFPMILVLTLALFAKAMLPAWRGEGRPVMHELEQPTTVIICAFFIYYCIYIFLPVVGPQFYFCAVGTDQIQQGHFPELGHYFATHSDMLPKPGWAGGLFHRLMELAQAAGERLTAAFPSSHIGVATIMLLLARRSVPRLLWLYVPLWVLLCCATVYIQAHYLIDAIAGLLSAPIVYWAALRLTKICLTRETAVSHA